jgi:hypothetical protein
MEATMARFALVGFALILAGCQPSLESFNERGGVIRHTQAGSNMAGVQAMADKYCAIYNRVARITSTDVFWSDDVTFDCVDK